MNKSNHIDFLPYRFYFILTLISLAVVGLFLRIVNLTVFEQPFLKKQGDERMLRLINLPAFRGMIMDRNGYPLAVSTSVYTAWVNPLTFDPKHPLLNSLFSLIAQKKNVYLQKIKIAKEKKREFLYLKRSLSPDIAKEIAALAIPGVYLQQSHHRFYPEGEVSAHLLGFTNVDDIGQEGLELAYNEWLQGEPGKKWVIKDRLGRMISDVRLVQEEKPGGHLTLSIDRRIQYLTYRELLAGMIANKAKSASAVVLDVMTGEILALVNVPSYNPNQARTKDQEFLRNRAVTDSFEPGSTIKTFSIVAALSQGTFSPTTLVDTTPGWIRVGRNIVRDEHTVGLLTLTEILQKSSNVGMTKVLLSLPNDALWRVLHAVGFGEFTEINFPGEQNGMLLERQPGGQFALATLGFGGYGMTATTLQLARAYAVIAHDGVKKPVSLLKVEQIPKGEQVIDKKVAHEVLALLEHVVQKGGTAEWAALPSYRVAGKTGTAKKVGAHGYEKSAYTSSFVGMAPVSQPRLVVAVVMHEPHGKYYYGGLVAGPVFAKVMEESLRLLNVAPDKS